MSSTPAWALRAVAERLVLRCLWLTALSAALLGAAAQPDTLIGHITLDEVVIRARSEGFDVPTFVQQVRTDTSFHKAFLNTRYHPHNVVSRLAVRGKEERELARSHVRGRLVRSGERATLVLDSVAESGRLRDRRGDHRYLTAEMYEEVFFPKGSFKADNTVAGRRLELERGGRVERYKSELKKFMFDPGSEIASVPFIGDKLALYDASMAAYYAHRIWSDDRKGRSCWVFSSNALPDSDPDDTVIKEMDTWFDKESGLVMARNYRIAHRSLFLDFDIRIAVENQVMEGQPVPVSVVYEGDWDIPFAKREIVRFDLHYSDWKIIR
ncbi:MAG: hypothetical protein R2817_08270 [Flavobacteriales bacterium]